MNSIYILFAFIISFLLYFYLTKNYNYWKNQNIPFAANAVPGFGHILPLFTLQDHFGKLIEKFHHAMGKRSMYGCYVMQTPAIVIRDPNLIKSVMESNFSCFRNNLLSVHEEVDPILAKNPFFAKDELWAESRALLATNFSGKKQRCMLLIVLNVCEKLKNFIDRYRDDNCITEFELKDLFSRVSAEVIANAAFGIEGQSFEDQPGSNTVVNLAKDVFDPSTIRHIQQLILYFLPQLAKIIGIGIVPQKTNNFIRYHLNSFIQIKLQNSNICDDFSQFSINDLNAVDKGLMTAKATSILFDGYESISSVLGFMIYRLADNSHVQDKARAELKSILEKFDNKLTYEAINSLNYLEQIILETLRLHPVFGDVTKICNKEITLQGYDTLSCFLRPKDIVMISVMGMHMDEEYWPNPQEFDPDRFNSKNVAKRHKFVYLAFGGGPRICPGKKMGIVIVKAVAAVILQNYVLEKSPKMKGPLRLNTSTFAAIAEDGLWVTFKPLNQYYC